MGQRYPIQPHLCSMEQIDPFQPLKVKEEMKNTIIKISY